MAAARLPILVAIEESRIEESSCADGILWSQSGLASKATLGGVHQYSSFPRKKKTCAKDAILAGGSKHFSIFP